jgi:hypothetical protein
MIFEIIIAVMFIIYGILIIRAIPKHVSFSKTIYCVLLGLVIYGLFVWIIPRALIFVVGYPSLMTKILN